MLKIMSDDGKAIVKVDGSIATITFDLVLAVRGVISSLAEQKEMLKDDDELIKTIRDILDDLEDDHK